MQRFTGHSDKCHDLEKFLFPSFTKLLNIVTTLTNKSIVVRKKIRPLKYSIKLQLGFVGRLRCHGYCAIGIPGQDSVGETAGRRLGMSRRRRSICSRTVGQIITNLLIHNARRRTDEGTINYPRPYRKGSGILHQLDGVVSVNNTGCT